MSKELFLSLLALDAYNHGYNAGIQGVGIQIGNATIVNEKGGSGDLAKGFYALSYEWGGKTVIPFRGTDNPALSS